MSNSTME